MPEVEGVCFDDADALLVEQLTRRINERFPELVRYPDREGGRNDIRFAYGRRVPEVRRADRIVIVVESKSNGRAFVRLSKNAEDHRLIPLTPESMESILNAAEQLYVRYSK